MHLKDTEGCLCGLEWDKKNESKYSKASVTCEDSMHANEDGARKVMLFPT